MPLFPSLLTTDLLSHVKPELMKLLGGRNICKLQNEERKKAVQIDYLKWSVVEINFFKHFKMEYFPERSPVAFDINCIVSSVFLHL